MYLYTSTLSMRNNSSILVTSNRATGGNGGIVAQTYSTINVENKACMTLVNNMSPSVGAAFDIKCQT